MTLIDITMRLSGATAPFPGDTPFTMAWGMQMRDGDSCNVSALHMSPHVGTHADAPYHYGDEGATMDAVDLSRYVGAARVLHVQCAQITAEDVESMPLAGATRVLFSTASHPDGDVFPSTFTTLTADAVDALANRGIQLVGVDTPSVDPADSKVLPAHRRFLARDVYILENLRLAHVAPGDYELIALPLFIEGADASPVRAVLRPLGAPSAATE